MNLPRLSGPAVALLCGVLLSLPGAFSARAHGPFDHSSQLTVGQDHLEVLVTMGADAAREFLAQSGLPATEIAALSPSPPRTPHALPVELAARLFDARVEGATLSASQVTVRTEGLDTLFKASYPRPGGKILALRAAYFNGIEPMKHGAFVACDQNLTTLATALLSRVYADVEIPLPVVAGLTQSLATEEATSVDQSPAPRPAGSSAFSEFLKLIFIRPVVAAAALLVVTVGACWLWRRTPKVE